MMMEMETKSEMYKRLVGRKFRPTFKSNIDHYEIRGYDDATEMVFTRVYPLDGTPFDDKIEEKYLIGAFETGDYEVCDRPKFPNDEPRKRAQLFNCPCCDRCVHRFGTTSNREWCIKHVGNDKCYRFKLDK